MYTICDKKMKQKIVIFGAGDIGRRAFKALDKDYDVLAYVDNNIDIRGKYIYNREVVGPDEVRRLNPDKVVIAMLRYIDVGRQLNEMGIKNVYVLKITDNGFEIDDYKLNKFEYIQLYRKCIFKEFEYNYEKIGMSSRKAQKNVLMVSYSFPPEGGPAVQRTLKFVKYLHEFGYRPIVLTCGKTNKYMRDDTLEREIPDCTKVIRIEEEPKADWNNILGREQELFDCFFFVSESKHFMNKLVSVQEQCGGHLLPDEKMFWIIECIRKIEDFIDMNEIDVIYTTAPPFSTHILGSFLKKKYGISWVADYRDLWTSSDDYNALYNPSITEEEIRLFRYLENILVENMDHIVVAGEYWKKGFIDRFNVIENKICEITNGYDEEDFENIKIETSHNCKFTLCYNGAMRYRNRNPEGLIQIINELINDGIIAENEIQWIINGKISSEYNRIIDVIDTYKIVYRNGMLSHEQSIYMAMKSDLLIFYGEKGEHGKINYPGKFYEYLRFGKKILCLSGENSFQDKILKETCLGENFDYGQKTEIKGFIGREYIRWKSGKQINPELDVSLIEKFERRNLTRKLASVMDLVQWG